MVELSPKRLQLLKEMVPGLQRVAVIWNVGDAGMTLRYQASEVSARKLGINVEAYSVREFCEKTFSQLGLDWKEFVEFDPRYLRPAEVDYLLGDPTKARDTLGWKPRVSFEELVKMMVDHDLEMAQREITLREAGHAMALPGVANV